MAFNPNPNPLISPNYNLLLILKVSPTMHLTEKRLERITKAQLRKLHRQADTPEEKREYSDILSDEVKFEAFMLHLEEEMQESFPPPQDTDVNFAAGNFGAFNLKNAIQWLIDHKEQIIAIVKLITSLFPA